MRGVKITVSMLAITVALVAVCKAYYEMLDDEAREEFDKRERDYPLIYPLLGILMILDVPMVIFSAFYLLFLR